MKLEVFDVEHGACALLTCDNGTRMMIDCATNPTTGWSPGHHLRAQGITNLDMLVVTNYDEDHVRGLPDLRARVNVAWLWRNSSVGPDDLRHLKSEDGMGPGIDELCDMARRYNSGLNVPRPEFLNIMQSVFWNDYPLFDDENNLSLVLFLKIDGIGFLFPGDLETAGWRTLLQRADFRQAVAETNVLVASHHGRDSGICTEIFDNYGCRPYYVVISDKGYMYDTQKTASYYHSKAQGGPFRGETRRVLTTRNDGCITFNFGPNGWGPA